MAEATEVSPVLVTDIGSQMMHQKTVTVVTTGDTWVTGLRSITSCGSNDPAGLTKMAPGSGATAGTITFTGTSVAALVWAIGYP